MFFGWIFFCLEHWSFWLRRSPTFFGLCGFLEFLFSFLFSGNILLSIPFSLLVDLTSAHLIMSRVFFDDECVCTTVAFSSML